MRLYLILALVVFLISVAGLLFSFWGVIVMGTTTSFLKIEEQLLPIFFGFFVFFLANICLLSMGYRQYKQQNFGRAKTYFGITFALLGGILMIALMLLSPTLWVRS